MLNNQRTAYKSLNDVGDNYHLYSIEWYADRIDFFIDDVKYFTFTNDGAGNFRTWPFDQRFHLLINIAVGGQWPGSPDNSTKFPSEMLIDFVRGMKLLKTSFTLFNHITFFSFFSIS